MFSICTDRGAELSHGGVVFHVDEVAGGRIRIRRTTIIAICIATSICDESSEGLGDAIASSSDGDVFISPFLLEIGSGRVGIVVEGDDVGRLDEI